jgi:hypothetical protein
MRKNPSGPTKLLEADESHTEGLTVDSTTTEAVVLYINENGLDTCPMTRIYFNQEISADAIIDTGSEDI